MVRTCEPQLYNIGSIFPRNTTLDKTRAADQLIESNQVYMQGVNHSDDALCLHGKLRAIVAKHLPCSVVKSSSYSSIFPEICPDTYWCAKHEVWNKGWIIIMLKYQCCTRRWHAISPINLRASRKILSIYSSARGVGDGWSFRLHKMRAACPIPTKSTAFFNVLL